MSNSNVSPTQSQVKSLTEKQRAIIDDLLASHPGITPVNVRYNYEHYCYARNWFVWVELPATSWQKQITITRCDHSETASEKAKAVRAYIASKQGGAE